MKFSLFRTFSNIWKFQIETILKSNNSKILNFSYRIRTFSNVLSRISNLNQHSCQREEDKRKKNWICYLKNAFHHPNERNATSQNEPLDHRRKTIVMTNDVSTHKKITLPTFRSFHRLKKHIIFPFLSIYRKALEHLLPKLYREKQFLPKTYTKKNLIKSDAFEECAVRCLYYNWLHAEKEADIHDNVCPNVIELK